VTSGGAQPAVEVTGLRMEYGDRPVLRGVDFGVRRGEVFCLLGPNGAGKTTTLEILEGFRARTGGSATVLGLDPAAQPARLRERIGIVLQECGFPRLARGRRADRQLARLLPPSPAPG
jgi:ABC-2 type transport system ATP-binding protein